MTRRLLLAMGVLLRGALAVTVFPVGDYIKLPETDPTPDQTTAVNSFRDALKRLANGHTVEFLESQADASKRQADYVLLSRGHTACKDAEATGKRPSDVFRPVAADVGRAANQLREALPKSTVLILPVAVPADASLTAHACASWVNAYLREQVYTKAATSAVRVLDLPATAPADRRGAAQEEALPKRLAQAVLPFLAFRDLAGEARVDGAPRAAAIRRRAEEAAADKKDEEGEYGYDWCLENYDKNECFDYYYGYDWCTENYEKQECFEYYYGYDWCVKHYEKTECHDYYYGEDDAAKDEAKKTEAPAPKKEEPKKESDSESEAEEGSGAGSGSGDGEYGYAWCLENYDDQECFEYYYGYKWCLDNYEDDECYDYYYPDNFEWNEETNYKWCLNFYLPNECEERYYPNPAGDLEMGDEESESSSFIDKLKSPLVIFGALAAVGALGGAYYCYKKNSSSDGPHSYDDENQLL